MSGSAGSTLVRQDRFAEGALQLNLAALFLVGVGLLVLWVINTSPIDWSWSGWPTVIALTTLVGILATAIGTLILALSTRDSVNLQRREFEAARQAALPLLEVYASSVSPGYFTINIHWVRGTEPAFDVQAWVKDNEGVYWYPHGTLPAGTGVSDTVMGSITAQDSLWPFSEATQNHHLESKDFFVGITWRSAEGLRGRHILVNVAGKSGEPTLTSSYGLEPSRIDLPSAEPPPTQVVGGSLIPQFRFPEQADNAGSVPQQPPPGP